MSDVDAGIVLLVVIAGVSPVSWHRRLRDYWLAAAAAGASSALAWTVAVLLLWGNTDPLLAIGSLFAILWSFVIARVVGVGFALARRRLERHGLEPGPRIGPAPVVTLEGGGNAKP